MSTQAAQEIPERNRPKRAGARRRRIGTKKLHALDGELREVMYLRLSAPCPSGRSAISSPERELGQVTYYRGKES